MLSLGVHLELSDEPLSILKKARRKDRDGNMGNICCSACLHRSRRSLLRNKVRNQPKADRKVSFLGATHKRRIWCRWSWLICWLSPGRQSGKGGLQGTALKSLFFTHPFPFELVLGIESLIDRR
jgi:hypothetical protein